MTTRKDIAYQFGLPICAIEQIGSKQLFIVNCCSASINFDSYSGKYYSGTLLVSYRTIVGVYHTADGEWKLTDKRYSLTTTRHMTEFAKTHNSRRLTEDEFNAILTVVGK